MSSLQQTALVSRELSSDVILKVISCTLKIIFSATTSGEKQTCCHKRTDVRPVRFTYAGVKKEEPSVSRFITEVDIILCLDHLKEQT